MWLYFPVLVKFLGDGELRGDSGTHGDGAQGSVNYSSLTAAEGKGVVLVHVLEYGCVVDNEECVGNCFAAGNFFLQHQRNVGVVHGAAVSTWKNAHNGVCIYGGVGGRNDIARMSAL